MGVEGVGVVGEGVLIKLTGNTIPVVARPFTLVCTIGLIGPILLD